MRRRLDDPDSWIRALSFAAARGLPWEPAHRPVGRRSSRPRVVCALGPSWLAHVNKQAGDVVVAVVTVDMRRGTERKAIQARDSFEVGFEVKTEVKVEA